MSSTGPTPPSPGAPPSVPSTEPLAPASALAGASNGTPGSTAPARRGAGSGAPDGHRSGAARPAGDRRAIAIEDVLRSRTRPGDLWAVLRDLWEEMPDRATHVSRILSLTLLEVALQLALALLGKNLLDDVMGAGTLSWTALLGAVALLGAIVATSWARQTSQEIAALRWRERAVERLARNISDGALDDLSAVPMAGLREIIMTDAPFVTRFGVETLSQLFVLALWVLAAFGFLALYGAPLLLVLAVVLALCFAIMAGGSVRHLRLTAERFRRIAALSQSARDVVEVERVLLTRQFGLGDRFVRGFGDAHAAFSRIALRQGRLSAGIRSGMSVLNAVGFLGLVVVGSTLIGSGRVEPGVLLAALFIVGQMLTAVIQMGDLAGRAAEAATGCRRLGVYWHAEAHVPANRTGAPDAAVTPADVVALEARGLSFGYDPRRPVFERVDLRLERGEIAAMTAATGAGKSTFARVLCGLLEPQAGRVEAMTSAGRADSSGTDARPIDSLSAGSVLYLGAQPILLPGSLRDNLLLDDGADSVRAEPANAGDLEAIRAALARDGVPLDWDDALVDAGGTGLSSGQMQLVQLARAVAREPAVVVFDEATGSLDMETEREVQSRLIDWCRRRVCLVVSHRPCPWLDAAGHHLKW